MPALVAPRLSRSRSSCKLAIKNKKNMPPQGISQDINPVAVSEICLQTPCEATGTPSTTLQEDLTPLVRRALAGDLEARNELFARSDGNVWRWSRSEVGAHRADDLRQEVLLRAHRKLNGLEVPEAYLGWLRIMTRRLAYNLLKKERPERRWWTSATSERSFDIFELIPGRETDPAMDFLNESDRKACLEIIWKVVETLEPAQRNLADLYYRQGKSVTQIAITLGSARKPKPQGTVKTLLNRLRKAIRRGVVEMAGSTTLPHEPMQA